MSASGPTALILMIGLAAGAAAQPTASDWVRDDRVFSMGGLYTHRAWSVDAGDIDGDGIDDMVFTTQDGRVEIYRGTGLPGDDAWERMLDWSDDIQLEVPTGPGSEWTTGWFVALIDLNGNGLPELFLTCGDSLDQKLCLERSLRPPYFWRQVEGPIDGLTGYLYATSVADVEGDGDLDIAALWSPTHSGDGYPVLFWNRGTTAQPVWDLDEDYFWPSGSRWPVLSLELGDVDGDGDSDLVMLEFCPEWCVYAWLTLNTGTALQPTWEVYQAPEWWEPICCADRGDLVVRDHDADGDQDILLLTAPMGQIYLFENTTSNGELVIGPPDLVAGTISGAEWCRATLGDLDWDGDQDLVVCFMGVDFVGPTTEHLQYRNDCGDSGTSWTPWWNFAIPVGGGWVTNHAMGDLDGDGHADALVLGNEPAVLWRRGTATAPQWECDEEAASGLPSYAGDPSFADFDGDGRPDITCRSQGVRRFFRNMGSFGAPVWIQWPSWGGGLPSGTAAFGHLDQDSSVDAVICASDSTLHCFLGQPGESSPWEETDLYLSGLKLPGSPTGMILTDLDGGAGNDLAVGLWNGELLYYSNTGPVCGEDALPSMTPLLAVWPNPTEGYVMIRLSSFASGPARLDLYDLGGRQVSRIWEGALQGQSMFNWDSSCRAPGSYVLRFDSSEGTATTRVIVR